MEARSGSLYDLYADTAEDAGEHVLSSRDFGLSMQAAGFEPDRDEDGRFYTGISVLTERQRAYAGVRTRENDPAYFDALGAGWREHEPGCDDCAHAAEWSANHPSPTAFEAVTHSPHWNTDLPYEVRMAAWTYAPTADVAAVLDAAVEDALARPPTFDEARHLITYGERW